MTAADMPAVFRILLFMCAPRENPDGMGKKPISLSITLTPIWRNNNFLDLEKMLRVLAVGLNSQHCIERFTFYFFNNAAKGL